MQIITYIGVRNLEGSTLAVFLISKTVVVVVKKPPSSPSSSILLRFSFLLIPNPPAPKYDTGVGLTHLA